MNHQLVYVCFLVPVIIPGVKRTRQMTIGCLPPSGGSDELLITVVETTHGHHQTIWRSDLSVTTQQREELFV